MPKQNPPPATNFKRDAGSIGFGLRGLTGSLGVFALTQAGNGGDPRTVPFSALEAMGTHPVIYLAERIVTGIIRRPNLYTVLHDDPKIAKETEEWLWPLLPVLLNAYGRAYAYGSVPVVFNLGAETLQLEVEGRNKKVKDHVHYTSAHAIRPSDVSIKTEDDDLVSVTFQGVEYSSHRARVLRWDPEFGSFRGQGARYRCWRDYVSSLIIEQLEANYLERSVDPPRIAYAPSGTQQYDGEEIDEISFMRTAVASLRGSGVCALPNSRDENGNYEYDVRLLEAPDREAIWNSAIERRDRRMFDAYLAIGGGDSAAQAKTLDGILKDIVQDLAQWVANDLTQIVELVHSFNYAPEKVKPAEIIATDVGKAGAQKLLAEIVKLASAEATKWIDMPTALDKLQVPILDDPLEKDEPPPMIPGVAPDLTSDREERREDARTEEGEDDTGQEDRPE